MLNSEYCVSYSDKVQCMGGELLIAVILLEMSFYIITFIFGWKIVDIIKSKFRKKELEKRELEEKRNNQKWKF
tara:strand:+ start:661 stop:879 length:219 start_codon:yes stop_codon:yes gene_type:complete